MVENELKSIQSKFYEMEQQLLRYRDLQSISIIDDLPEILRKERKKQHLTLKGLAELSVVSYSTLVKLESGDDRVNLRTLKQVAKTLGIKLWVG
ncbi:MAG: hypothetical protein B6241_01000 [Spirochaetaceae bacterium 4572_59]|nr:MAG: hypothetical protein B6241_01000 [Spirochaetaceae bacterium 4572_59]